MGAATRLDLTLRLVQGSGTSSVSELSERLGVSEMTVRRDLNTLERQGLVRRVHGGAVAVRSREEGGGFTARRDWQVATKSRLGAEAALMVKPGSKVLLDAGTTTLHVAKNLVERAPLTIAVLSLHTASALADSPGIELLVVGGRSQPGECSFVGPLTIRTLESLSFDCFIMSIGGIHAEQGWSEFSLDDAAVKQTGSAQSTRTICVGDATKLGVRAFSRVAPLGAVESFVTDAAADDPLTHPKGPSTLQAMREAGVEVKLV
ncbi:DeoR/GlpR family DNA-binding transcription regulator [Streptomyces sp. NPDC018964]|uniref:DeoR/GlpR family DNA-binding transcription regulator n=1 Tax=unclassified Streptomyces TaxID=2593676 RepID=UPI003795CF27